MNKTNDPTAFAICIILALIAIIILFGGLLISKNKRDKKYLESINPNAEEIKELNSISTEKEVIKEGMLVSANLDDGSFIKGKVVKHIWKYGTLAIVFNANKGCWGYKNKGFFTPEELKEAVGYENHWMYPSNYLRNIKILEK